MQSHLEHQKEIAQDKKTGSRLASSILKSLPKDIGTTRRISIILSSMLVDLWKAEPDSECGNQMLEWTIGQLWGRLLEDQIPEFMEAYDTLERSGHTVRNALSWCDSDYYAWIEPCSHKRVIVVENAASCRDNKYIFILNNEEFGSQFHARTASSRTVRPSYSSGGWEYVSQASLKLYRDQGFSLKYGDFRDIGYCFSLGGIGGMKREVDGHLGEEFYAAIWYMKCLFKGVAEIEND